MNEEDTQTAGGDHDRSKHEATASSPEEAAADGCALDAEDAAASADNLSEQHGLDAAEPESGDALSPIEEAITDEAPPARRFREPAPWALRLFELLLAAAILLLFL